jgi:hypothetical protein
MRSCRCPGGRYIESVWTVIYGRNEKG